MIDSKFVVRFMQKSIFYFSSSAEIEVNELVEGSDIIFVHGGNGTETQVDFRGCAVQQRRNTFSISARYCAPSVRNGDLFMTNVQIRASW